MARDLRSKINKKTADTVITWILFKKLEIGYIHTYHLERTYYSKIIAFFFIRICFYHIHKKCFVFILRDLFKYRNALKFDVMIYASSSSIYRNIVHKYKKIKVIFLWIIIFVVQNCVSFIKQSLFSHPFGIFSPIFDDLVIRVEKGRRRGGEINTKLIKVVS